MKEEQRRGEGGDDRNESMGMMGEKTKRLVSASGVKQSKLLTSYVSLKHGGAPGGLSSAILWRLSNPCALPFLGLPEDRKRQPSVLLLSLKAP